MGIGVPPCGCTARGCGVTGWDDIGCAGIGCADIVRVGRSNAGAAAPDGPVRSGGCTGTACGAAPGWGGAPALPVEGNGAPPAPRVMGALPGGTALTAPGVEVTGAEDIGARGSGPAAGGLPGD